MPSSLDEAVDALSASAMFREALGNEFIDHYISVRRQEIGRFQVARHRLGTSRVFRSFLTLRRLCLQQCAAFGENRNVKVRPETSPRCCAASQAPRSSRLLRRTA